MNDIINDAIDQIIINLKTIGKLKMNDKLYIFNGYVMIQKESFYRSLIRTLYGYSREQSCQLIEEITQKAIRSSIVLLGIQNIVMGENVMFLNYLKILIQFRDAFSLCKDGLNNFARTYSDDLTIVSRIENLIAHINSQLTLIDSKLETEEYKIFVIKYFPQKLEKYITSSQTPLNTLNISLNSENKLGISLPQPINIPHSNNNFINRTTLNGLSSSDNNDTNDTNTKDNLSIFQSVPNSLS
jgi:hypothetical protein